MVASEIIIMKKAGAEEVVKTIVLPSNARDIMINVNLNSSGDWKLQHSFDGSTWLDKTSASTTGGLSSITGPILQQIRVVFGTPNEDQTVKVYLGRSK